MPRCAAWPFWRRDLFFRAELALLFDRSLSAFAAGPASEQELCPAGKLIREVRIRGCFLQMHILHADNTTSQSFTLLRDHSSHSELVRFAGTHDAVEEVRVVDGQVLASDELDGLLCGNAADDGPNVVKVPCTIADDFDGVISGEHVGNAAFGKAKLSQELLAICPD
jgi:hypothetical protein